MEKIVIGRFDKADFPALHLNDIAIKIDTGAYTSSIHCENIIEEDDVIHCTFLDEEHPLYNGKKFVFEDYDVVIFTAKAKPDRGLINGKTGTQLVWEWLKKHDMDKFVTKVTAEKPRAVRYIDDKGVRFTSWSEYWKEYNGQGPA